MPKAISESDEEVEALAKLKKPFFFFSGDGRPLRWLLLVGVGSGAVQGSSVSSSCSWMAAGDGVASSGCSGRTRERERERDEGENESRRGGQRREKEIYIYNSNFFLNLVK